MVRRDAVALGVVILLGLFAPVRIVHAQGPPPPPPPQVLMEELDRTDRRIELAEMLIPETSDGPALQELMQARTLQTQAKQAFAAHRPELAIHATLGARGHADRAISIVRGLPDPDHVSVQVDRTRDLLDRARDRLDACDDPRARAQLHVALEMQTRAEAALAESRYLAALQLTMSARERVFQALRRCNVEESLQDAAQRAILRTDEVLYRTHEAIDGATSARARALVQRASAVQPEAQAEFHAGRYESALRFTQAARVMAQRALRASREGAGANRR